MIVQDPIFGSLERRESMNEDHWSWSAILALPVWLDAATPNLPAGIQTGIGQAPGEQEYAVWNTLVLQPPGFKKVLGQAMLEHYQNILYPRNLPVLSDACEVWQRIRLLVLWIRATEPGGCELILDYAADWNKEYGLSVWFYTSSFEVGAGLAAPSERLKFDLEGQRIS